MPGGNHALAGAAGGTCALLAVGLLVVLLRKRRAAQGRRNLFSGVDDPSNRHKTTENPGYAAVSNTSSHAQAHAQAGQASAGKARNENTPIYSEPEEAGRGPRQPVNSVTAKQHGAINPGTASLLPGMCGHVEPREEQFGFGDSTTAEAEAAYLEPVAAGGRSGGPEAVYLEPVVTGRAQEAAYLEPVGGRGRGAEEAVCLQPLGASGTTAAAPTAVYLKPRVSQADDGDYAALHPDHQIYGRTYFCHVVRAGCDLLLIHHHEFWRLFLSSQSEPSSLLSLSTSPHSSPPSVIDIFTMFNSDGAAVILSGTAAVDGVTDDAALQASQPDHQLHSERECRMRVL